MTLYPSFFSFWFISFLLLSSVHIVSLCRHRLTVSFLLPDDNRHRFTVRFVAQRTTFADVSILSCLLCLHFLGFIPFCLAVSNAWNMFHASLWQPIWLHSFKPTILSGCVFFLFQRSHSTMAVLWNQKKTRKEWRQNGWKSNDASFFPYALTSPLFDILHTKFILFKLTRKAFLQTKTKPKQYERYDLNRVSHSLRTRWLTFGWFRRQCVCACVCVFVENIVRPITIPSCPYYIVVFFFCFFLNQSQY